MTEQKENFIPGCGCKHCRNLFKLHNMFRDTTCSFAKYLQSQDYSIDAYQIMVSELKQLHDQTLLCADLGLYSEEVINIAAEGIKIQFAFMSLELEVTNYLKDYDRRITSINCLKHYIKGLTAFTTIVICDIRRTLAEAANANHVMDALENFVIRQITVNKPEN